MRNWLKKILIGDAQEWINNGLTSCWYLISFFFFFYFNCLILNRSSEMCWVWHVHVPIPEERGLASNKRLVIKVVLGLPCIDVIRFHLIWYMILNCYGTNQFEGDWGYSRFFFSLKSWRVSSPYLCLSCYILCVYFFFFFVFYR